LRAPRSRSVFLSAELAALLTLMCAFVAGLPAGASAATSNPMGVVIDSLRANETIWGHVWGGKPSEYAGLRVVGYVQTDKWYIHPYDAEGEGSSWATVKPDGTWQLPTVRRESPASRIAVLLVRRTWKHVNQPATLEKLPPGEVVAISIVSGTGDL
jgi:hypothetical protein